MKNKINASILFATAALGLGACGPVVPEIPTWVHDVRPLMVARCIRCHDGNGHVDPATAALVPWGAKAAPVAYNFSYATVENPLQTGLATLKALGPGSVHGKPYIMPPPPAEKLEDWEIETLTNWAAQKTPL